MSFNFKPQGQSNNANSDRPKVDYNKINEQVEADNTPAVISLIVDLGVHTPDLNVSDQRKSTFDSREEAEEYLERIISIKGDKDGAKFNITEVGSKFEINGEIYQPKEGQEVAIFADFPDQVVDYGEPIGKKPFRIALNKSWMGDLKGMSLKVVPPQSGNVWTFAGNSMLSKLAVATKQTVVTDGTDPSNLNNIGLLLGKPLMVDLVKTKKNDNVYINFKSVSTLPKAMEKGLDFSAVNPVGITFDNATKELLEQANLRFDVIKKIKAANNYKGSNMQKALEELEGAPTPTGVSNDESPAEDLTDDWD